MGLGVGIADGELVGRRVGALVCERTGGLGVGYLVGLGLRG